MALEFNKSDFENIIFSNIFVNQTSGTECKEPKKINLIEVSKVGITLRAVSYTHLTLPTTPYV